QGRRDVESVDARTLRGNAPGQLHMAGRGSAAMDQALSGVRIIDMTHNQAGPACTQILGFLGADVIKLEEPTGGDIARLNMRDQKNSDSLFFLILNANKRSLTLNLKTDAGKD